MPVRGIASVLIALGVIASASLVSVSSTGCLTSNYDPFANEAGAGEGGVTIAGDDPSQNDSNKDAIPYRDLATHPGCSTVGLDTRKALAYTAANIPGYKCAAKQYPVTNDDPNKPIILLIHGNSSTPADYETFAGDTTHLKMLSERLMDAGYKIYAVDQRYDLVDDPTGNNTTENAGQNFDHGWGVPIIEAFVDAILTNNPGRKISIVGFSVGPTMIRDALRRLHRDKKKPFGRIKDLIYASGAHHGVSSFRALCGPNPTMRGKIACELGDRTTYTPTAFAIPNNGPNGDYETPCLDGVTAYGQQGVCDGNKVRYTTIVMQDVSQGTYQDEFVSQGSAMLKGANNLTVGLTDNDLSGYFYNGLFKNHYGAIRSEAALKTLMATLTAP